MFWTRMTPTTLLKRALMVPRLTAGTGNWNLGLDTNDSSFEVPNNALTEAQNMRIDDIGNAVKRQGFKNMLSSATGASDYMTTIHQYMDATLTKTIYAISGSKLYQWDGVNTDNEVVDFFGNKKSLSVNLRASMFSWKNSLFVSNGSEPGFEYGQFPVNGQFVFSADSTNDTILKFNTSGILIQKIGSHGTANGQFSGLGSIAVDYTNGYIYAYDTAGLVGDDTHAQGRIQKFDINGNFKSVLTNTIVQGFTGGNVLNGPLDVKLAVDTSGYLYASIVQFWEGYTAYLVKYDSYLNYISSATLTHGSPTTGAIAVDSTNSAVYVATNGDNKVYKKKTSDLSDITNFGGTGTGNGQFKTITGMWVDETNSILYCVDSLNARVQKLSLTGTYSAQWSVANALGIFVLPAQSLVFVGTSTPALIKSDLSGGSQVSYSMTGMGTLVALSGCPNSTSNAFVFKDIGAPLSPLALNIQTFTGTASHDGTNQLTDSNTNFGALNFDAPVPTGTVITNVTTGKTDTAVKIKTFINGNDTIVLSSLNFTQGDQYSFSVPMFGSVTQRFDKISTGTATNDLLDSTMDFTTANFGASMLGVTVYDDTTSVHDTVINVFDKHTLVFASMTVGSGDSYHFSLTQPAGLPSGTYKYKVTYETASGNESTGGIESNLVAVTNQYVHLSNISQSPMSALTTGPVAWKNIYRSYSSDGGSTWNAYKLVGTINASRYLSGVGVVLDQQTFDDNIQNGKEGVSIPTANSLVPSFKYLYQFRDCLFGAGDPGDNDYLYWTSSTSLNTPNNEDYWYMDNFLPVGEGELGQVTGITSIGDSLLVFKDSSIWRIMFTVSTTDGSIAPQSPIAITQQYGCSSHFMWDFGSYKGKNGIYFWDQNYGFCFTDGTKAFPVSNAVFGDIQNINKTLMKNGYMCFNYATKECMVALPVGGGTNNEIWIFNAWKNCIYKPWTVPVCSLTKIIDSNGAQQVYAGNFNGMMIQMNSGNDDNGSAIDGWISSPWMNYKMPNNTKHFDQIVVDFTPIVACNVTLYWATDGQAFNSIMSAVIPFVNVGIRDKYMVRPVDLTGRTLTGKTVRYKLENANADEPFEICAVSVQARIHKVNATGTP